MSTIRILVAAEPSMLRDGVRALLRAVEDFTLVDEEPDVAVVDAPANAGAATRIVLLTASVDDRRVDAAVRAGVDGFVLTAEAGTCLIAAVRAVAAGQAWLSPPFARRLLDLYRAAPAVPRPTDGRRFSERERSVLRLVAHGRTNAEIANELVLGESTVKTHVSRLLTKLELRDRVQLAVFAHHHGLT